MTIVPMPPQPPEPPDIPQVTVPAAALYYAGRHLKDLAKNLRSLSELTVLLKNPPGSIDGLDGSFAALMDEIASRIEDIGDSLKQEGEAK